jgi:hypothetical protein
MMQSLENKVRVAVVTGGHSFDVPNFHELFRNLEGIDAYIQHIDDFCSSPEEMRDSYDAVLFYIMMIETPTDDGLTWFAGKPKTALEHLGETQQGIFLLHHALLAYPKWPVWNEIVGIEDRSLSSYHIGETIKVEIANPEHPITRGLSAWEMVDETYVMNDAGEGNEILLTADHPNSMKTIAWTRNYRNARVFCCESGHDNRTWSDPNFGTVVERGIKWAARGR